MRSPSGETTLEFSYEVPSSIRLTLTGKNFLLDTGDCSSRYFPLRAGPVLEGFCCTQNQTGSCRSYLPAEGCKKKKYGGVSIHLEELQYLG